ncbi:hypothetical protein [Moorella sulfitireducens (nom. illeg.)]|uniref:hypothetical protein n=1 Tax=Neomoorella sulfitireducens TaxID=2972948 RepID=UPI0021ABE732|nr:hypothetical protein [Moorella sulfitireducens]
MSGVEYKNIIANYGRIIPVPAKGITEINIKNKNSQWGGGGGLYALIVNNWKETSPLLAPLKLLPITLLPTSLVLPSITPPGTRISM